MGSNNGGGRRPDPIPLRLLKNDKAHAHRYKDRDEPVPSENRAIAPEGLSLRATELFYEFVNRVEEMYPCSETDSYAIVLYANNHEQLEYLENYLRIEGISYESETKWGSTVKTRPEVAIHKQCKDFELKILTEFGLTPSSRARVPVKPKGKEQGNPFASLGKTQSN